VKPHGARLSTQIGFNRLTVEIWTFYPTSWCHNTAIQGSVAAFLTVIGGT
jgi:hypothetical protein